ncbi:MAG TPA: carboxypeptidase-like regulatory domain-containing protein [Flavobacteriaceae bacterium]|nr:carboxypeptidase-like regulatory domain-containing protein [Flavobacteriaceae bacterium]
MQKIIFFFILFLGINTFAQSVKVVGTVTDNDSNPLSMASIIAKEKTSGSIETYAITNHQGKFQLSLGINNTYLLEVSYLGFSTYTEEIQTGDKKEDISKNISLHPTTDELEGVELIYEMPVVIKGDTIVYNTDSFVTGKEKKLEDVIKALPGLDVTEDGEIQVEGKTVQKVMVEGKDFFDGDSKLASKNIPADAVSKVEVLRNYNEVSQLQGLTNTQDQVAINIRLKEGKTNFWFGEISAGAGYSEEKFRYIASPRLFYYSPENSASIITNFNNNGEVPFTFRDYFRFTGGFRNFNSSGGTRFNINDNGLGFLMMQNDRANEIESEFAAANFSSKLSAATNLSGFTILSNNRTNFITSTVRRFISTGETEERTSTTDQSNQLGMIKLSAVYKPGPRFQLDYDVLGRLAKQSENSDELSVFDQTMNQIYQGKENKPFSVNQNINAYYTLNDNNIFAGQFQYLLQNENPFYNALVDIFPFAEILDADDEQSVYNINQDKEVMTHKLDGKIDYFYVINNKSNINVTLGTTQSIQQFDSEIFQILDNNGRINFDQTPEIGGNVFALGNDVRYHFSDAFLGVKYKVMFGKFTLTPGATLHNYNLDTRQTGGNHSQNQWMVLPEFFALAQLKSSESIRFQYSMTSEYTDINNYAEGFVLNNYNQLYRGNRYLENALSNSFSLGYYSFNMFNYTNLMANVNYTRRVNAVKNFAEIIAINQVSYPVNIGSNFADETFSAFGSFGKRIKKIQYTASANVSWNSYNNIINNQITNSESFTHNYSLSARSHFKEFPNFEAGYNLTFNEYNNGGISSTFYTHRPFLKLDFVFLKDFTADINYNFYHYSDSDKTVKNTYSFLNANVYYQKKDSKWEYRLQATNLLDTQSINRDSFSELYNTTSYYYVMPRILMFTVKYSL